MAKTPRIYSNATALTPGIVTTEAQTFGGVKTFQDPPVVFNASGIVAASTSAAGIVTTEAQAFAGTKTFQNGLISSSPLMFRNKIINGNFDFWQRSTSAANPSAPAGGYASADRWKIIGHASNINYSSATLTQTTDVPSGSKFAGKLVSTNAGLDDVAIMQIIESANCLDLPGKVATLSLSLKKYATLTGRSLVIGIYSLNTANVIPTSIVSNSMDNCTLITSLTIAAENLPTSWTKYTLTTPVLSAAAANGIIIRVSLNSIDLGLGDLFGIAQVQFEVGSVATPFEYRPVGIELGLCQRYYEKSYDQQTTPGTAATYTGRVVSVYSTADGVLPGTRWKVSKRIAPVIVIYNTATGGTSSVRRYNGSINTAITASSTTSGTEGIDYISGTFTASSSYDFHYTADAEL